jgi:hypothetical protein
MFVTTTTFRITTAFVPSLATVSNSQPLFNSDYVFKKNKTADAKH